MRGRALVAYPKNGRWQCGHGARQYYARNGPVPFPGPYSVYGTVHIRVQGACCRSNVEILMTPAQLGTATIFPSAPCCCRTAGSYYSCRVEEDTSATNSAILVPVIQPPLSDRTHVRFRVTRSLSPAITSSTSISSASYDTGKRHLCRVQSHHKH